MSDEVSRPKSGGKSAGKDAAWPVKQLEDVPAKDLTFSDDNPKTHSDAQIDQIVASIEEFGWTIPVVIDEANVIIAGHGRVMAARRMGMTIIPCARASGWSDAQKRAYLIADNKLTENGSWDMGALGRQFEALSKADYSLEVTGFADVDIGGIVADNPILKSRTETLRPIRMQHVLISYPVDADPGFLDEAVRKARELGGSVDYGGN